MNVRVMSLAVAGLLALLFLSQGLTAPFEKDEESRPAWIIVDIVHRGHWMLPDDVYGEVTRKPPLFYWLSAALAEARGGVTDEAGARAVSLIAAAGLSMLVMGYASAWLDGVAGWIAWMVLLSCYGFCSHAAYARTDMLFTFLLFGAYCLLYPMLEGGATGRYWLPAGLIMGLAILTKGPLAAVLCGLAVAVYLLMVRRNPLSLAAQSWAWGTLVVAAIVAAAWYVPALIETHGAIAKVQFMQENLGHFVPAKLGGTGEASRPFYYLLVRFIGTSLPFSLYIPALLVASIPLRASARPQLYQLAFLIAVLGLFSIASAKRDDYILPAFAPFAILVAAIITAGAGKIPPAAERLRRAVGLVAAAAMLIATAGGLVLSRQPALVGWLGAHMQSSDAAYLRLFVSGARRPHEAALILAAATASIVALVLWRRGRAAQTAIAIALAGMAGVSLWIGIIRPNLAARRAFKEFAIQMRAVTAGQPVYTPDGPDYEISYYYGQPIRELAWVSHTRRYQPRYVLIQDNWVKFRHSVEGSEVLASRPALDGHRMVLLKIGSIPFEPNHDKH